MGFGGAVGDRLGMGVGLVPDDFGAQPPARILEGECQSPGNADQVFGLQALGSGRPDRHGPSPVLAVWGPVPSIAGGIGVAHVQPCRAVVGQHSAHLVEGHDDALDVFPQSVVASDLPLGRIVPKRPVGRRRHHRLHAAVREQPQGFDRGAAHQCGAIERVQRVVCPYT